MDAITPRPPETRFLPALADALKSWFPELDRRAVPVAEMQITKENVPQLPLAVVALVSETATPPQRSPADRFDITIEFLIEFWMQPQRIPNANGGETPFWDYYPYEKVRDKLLTKMARWEAPNCEHISFRSMGIEADSMAVTLTFRFRAIYGWAAKHNEYGDPFKVDFVLCAPESCVPEWCEESTVECDPCK
jgi:hypothetical protein